MENRLAAVARPAGDRLLDLGVVLVLVGGLVLPILTTRAVTGDPVLLNEMLVSHTGSDTTEFVELYGTPGHSLDGLSLVVVEGDNSAAGTIDLRVDFGPDDHLGGNGFFLLGRAAGLSTNYGVTPDVALAPVGMATDVFENGSQTFALVVTTSVGAVGSQVTGTEAVLDSVGLWDAGEGDSFPWSPVLGLDDGFLPPGARRATDGVDTDSPGDWVFADDMLGSANTPMPATEFDDPPVATCPASVSTTFGTATSVPVSATDPDGMVVDFTLSADPDPGTLTLVDVVPAGSTGGTATATLRVGGATPAGTYEVTVTATTDATPEQEASCTVTVTVEDPPPPQDGGDLADLLAAFDALVADGSVDSGKAAQLRGHLERAIALAEEGKAAASAAQLQAFANQVEGMSPRWVTPAAAQELAAAARALIAG
jgi:hypothetical protein